MESNNPKLIELVFKVLQPARIIGLELARQGQGLTEEEVASAVSERLKVFEAGLSPEREFMAVANWLGRIQSINRIDQTPLPRCNDNAAEVRVPDLLCVASVNGSRLPLLIEVKRSDEPKLVWSEKYISQLRAYAEMLHMPLLLAWKHNHIWTLTDVRHFTKKVTSYHLDFRKAMMENLMSLIFGDLMLELTQRVAFFLDAEILEASEPLPSEPGPLPEGPYNRGISPASGLLLPGSYKMKTRGGFLLDAKPLIEFSVELDCITMSAPRPE